MLDTAKLTYLMSIFNKRKSIKATVYDFTFFLLNLLKFLVPSVELDLIKNIIS